MAQIADKPHIQYQILTDLLQTVLRDHPEFMEENTTGKDLIDAATEWQAELQAALM